jgi:hypothetical protein
MIIELKKSHSFLTDLWPAFTADLHRLNLPDILAISIIYHVRGTGHEWDHGPRHVHFYIFKTTAWTSSLHKTISFKFKIVESILKRSKE